MAPCDFCGTSILFGGISEGGYRFCNDACRQGGRHLSMAEEIPDADVERETRAVHEGVCPRCGGPGPVDVRVAHTVLSAVIVSQWRSHPEVSCRGCGVRENLKAIGSSALLGWWGFPWGLIMTPVQLTRNVVALVTSPDPTRPSDDLEQMVRLDLAARRAAPPAEVSTVTGPAPPTREIRTTLSPRAIVLLSAFITVVVLGGFTAFSIHTARNRHVWLVNGLDRPYEVTINGRVHRLPPHEQRRLELGEGTLEIRSNTPGLDLGVQSATIESPFWTRPFQSRMYVLNPDRTAVLEWEQAVFTTKPLPDDPTAPSQLFVGRHEYMLRGVDYEFEPFPEQIDLSSSGRREFRERVSLLNPDIDGSFLVQIVQVEVGAAEAIALVERRLEYDPAGGGDVHVLRNLLEPDRFFEIAAPRLRERPVLVEWHRAYQEAAKASRPEIDLEAEYRALHDSDPDHGDLMYLCARIIADPSEAEAMYRRATRAEPPSSFAFGGLAYDRLINGRYEEGLEFVDRAIELGGGRAGGYEQVRYECLEGLGRFDELLRSARGAQRRDPIDLGPVQAEVYYLTRLDRSAEAAQRATRFVELLTRRDYSRDEQRWTRGFLQLTIASAGDRVDEFIRTAGAQPELGYLSDAAFLSGDLSGAAERLAASGDASLHELLIIYARAAELGERELAQAHFAAAKEAVGESYDPEWRTVLAWIEAGEAPGPDDVRRLGLLPAEKRVAMLALGGAFPRARDRYWSLARTLNYDRRWPYLSVRMVLEP